MTDHVKETVERMVAGPVTEMQRLNCLHSIADCRVIPVTGDIDALRADVTRIVRACLAPVEARERRLREALERLLVDAVEMAGESCWCMPRMPDAEDTGPCEACEVRAALEDASCEEKERVSSVQSPAMTGPGLSPDNHGAVAAAHASDSRSASTSAANCAACGGDRDHPALSITEHGDGPPCGDPFHGPPCYCDEIATGEVNHADACPMHGDAPTACAGTGRSPGEAAKDQAGNFAGREVEDRDHGKLEHQRAGDRLPSQRLAERRGADGEEIRGRPEGGWASGGGGNVHERRHDALERPGTDHDGEACDDSGRLDREGRGQDRQPLAVHVAPPPDGGEETCQHCGGSASMPHSPYYCLGYVKETLAALRSRLEEAEHSKDAALAFGTEMRLRAERGEAVAMRLIKATKRHEDAWRASIEAGGYEAADGSTDDEGVAVEIASAAALFKARREAEAALAPASREGGA